MVSCTYIIVFFHRIF